MIDYVDASKFLQDSLDKQIHINSVDGTISITNADIVGESFTLTESICSEENLIFGSCEPSCIKFTVKNTIPKMYKKWFNVTIELQGSSTPFVVGEYRVWSEKPSSDRTTKEITAYDDLYGIFRNTYKRWYKNLWTNTDTMTIKQFRDAWFTRLQQTHSHISQETTTLVNDDVIIKKSKKITKPSGKDIFNAICEINGVFGKIGRDGVFHYITLNDSSTTYPIANAQTIEVDYEDYTTTAIDRLEILDPEGDILGYAGESADDAENTYTIENNFMLKGLGNDDSAKSTGDFLAQNIFGILQYVTFIPIDANFKGNPCFETGDRISFAAHGNTITSYILERTMKGIQSLRDNYMSEGDIEYPESVNTYSAKIKELKNDVGSKSTNNVNTANVSSLNDVNDGDTYFKINQSRTIFKKYTASNVAVADLVQNSNGISFNVTTNTSGEHETIIFKLEGLTVGETIQIEWYYRITQWNNSYYNSYVWGVGFSEIYPIHDASGYNVYPLGYPVSSGQGVAKTKTYNGKTCYWYTFEYSTSWKSVTWISPKATAKTMYLYFSSDDVTDGQTFKWEVSNLKFTQPVTLVDSEPKKEVDELYVNSDGDWYRFSQSDASHNSVGSAQPTEAKTGDLNVLTAPPIRIESFRDSICSYWHATQLSLNNNGKYNITVTGYSSDDMSVTPSGSINAARFKAIGFGGAGTYHIKCKMQFDGFIMNPWGERNMGLYIYFDDSGIPFSGTLGYGQIHPINNGAYFLNMYFDNAEHEYSFDFTIDAAHATQIQNKTMYITVVVDRCWKYYNGDPAGTYASGTLTIKDLEITGQNTTSNTDILGLQVNVDGTWKNVDYVNDVSQTQSSTGGTEIAEIQNTNGTKTKIYQKTVDPNPQSTATELLSKITIGDTTYDIGGASSVSTLEDVDLTNLSDGQVLKYNSTAQKWKNIEGDWNKNIVSTSDPSSSVGNNNDVYYKLSSEIPSDYTKLKLTITADRSSDGYTQLSRVDIIKTDDTLYSWSGTSVSANVSSYGGEGADKLIDGSTSTKFCGIATPSTSSPVVLTFNLGTAISPTILKQWKWYTANDATGRDPVSFTLSASADGTNWVELDSVSGATITTDRNALAYTGDITPAENPSVQKKFIKVENSWIEDGSGGGGGASAVSDLTDVDLTSLSDGQILKYSSANQKWENANESGGGGTESVEMTWDEYQALTSEEKHDLTKAYYINDYGTGSGTRMMKVDSYVTTVTTSQYGWIAGVKDKFGNNLTKNDEVLGIDVMIADATNYPSFMCTYIGSSWYAKAINLNTFQPIQSAITFKVRITYIKNISSEA